MFLFSKKGKIEKVFFLVKRASLARNSNQWSTNSTREVCCMFNATSIHRFFEQCFSVFRFLKEKIMRKEAVKSPPVS